MKPDLQLGKYHLYPHLPVADLIMCGVRGARYEPQGQQFKNTPSPHSPIADLMMCGVRYASAAAVKPRGTILTIGMTTDDKEIC